MCNGVCLTTLEVLPSAHHTDNDRLIRNPLRTHDYYYITIILLILLLLYYITITIILGHANSAILESL